MHSCNRGAVRGFFLKRRWFFVVMLALALGSCSDGTEPRNTSTEYTVSTYTVSEELSYWESIQRFSVSPHGERIVYHLFNADPEHQTSKILSVPTTGGPSVRLYYDDATDNSIWWYDITPDGKYVVTGIFLGIGQSVDLYSVPIGGGELVKLNEKPMFYFSALKQSSYFEISADSRWVVYPSAATEDLRIVPVTGGPSRSLSGRLRSNSLYDLSFRISPDSKYVVYDALYLGSNQALYSVSVEGGEPVQLSHEEIRLPYPIYGISLITPDSTRVVYVYITSNGDVNYHLGVIPISGGGVADLYESPNVPYFSLTSDARFIVGFLSRASGGPRDLLVIPLNGDPVRNLSAALETVGVVDGYVTTPDSRYVVIKIEDEEHGSDLYRAPMEGGEAVPLVTSIPVEAEVRLMAVSSDSRRLLYSVVSEAQQTADLYSVPLSGGSTQHLCSGAQGLISPDSRLVLCESGELVSTTGGPALDIAGDRVLSWYINRYPGFAYAGENKHVVWASETTGSSEGALFVSVLEEKTKE